MIKYLKFVLFLLQLVFSTDKYVFGERYFEVAVIEIDFIPSLPEMRLPNYRFLCKLLFSSGYLKKLFTIFVLSTNYEYFDNHAFTVTNKIYIDKLMLL